MSEFHSARFLDLRPKLLSRVVQRASVYLANNEEMGDGRPALRGALRHQTGDGAAAIDCGSRCNGFRFRGRENVGGQDFSTWPRSADIREIHAALAGQASRFGGNL